MPKKICKKITKKEELPSFLRNLSSHKLENKILLIRKEYYSNPIFFGQCKQFHGTPHPVFLDGFSRPQYSAISEENLHSELFLPENEIIQKPPKPAIIPSRKIPKKKCIDVYPQRRPGVRKAFVPDVKVITPDFGETSSEIESDTWREIPFCRIKSTTYESSYPELENVTLSDVKEKNRALLQYEQRMAHNHFPKEFITVRLIGPVIPASITITKIPSKRRRISDFALEVEKKVIKKIKSVTETADKEIDKKTEEEMGEAVEINGIKIEEVEGEKEEVEEKEKQEEKVLEEEKEPGGASEEEEAQTTFMGIIVEEEEEEAEVVNEEESIEDDKRE